MQFIAFQVMPSLEKEGLPYWIFWSMLLIILLLLLFIFLRDKKLRLRLSSFFAGAKRRSVLFQLKYQLKRERQKKDVALKRLGEKAWDRDIPVDGARDVRTSLGQTLKRRDAAQMEWKNAFTELERHLKRLEETTALFEQKLRDLQAQKQPLEELYKKKRGEEKALNKQSPGIDIERQLGEVRRELDNTFGPLDGFERQIKEVEAEKREQEREIAREVHHWKRKKEKLQEHIKEIEAHQRSLYLSLGEILEQKRVDSRDFDELYGEIDVINGRIDTLEHRIETLSG